MGVKYLYIYGTRQEVQGFKAHFHWRKSDRISSERPIYQHMEKHLGCEIIDLDITVSSLTPAVIQSIKDGAKEHPHLLWRIADRMGKEVEINGERLSNFAEEDPDFPGPFGALCRVYGKPFWNRKGEA